MPSLCDSWLVVTHGTEPFIKVDGVGSASAAGSESSKSSKAYPTVLAFLAAVRNATVRVAGDKKRLLNHRSQGPPSAGASNVETITTSMDGFSSFAKPAS